MPGPAANAIATWRAAIAFASPRSEGAPVWASGKSYGGRMASMAVAEAAELADSVAGLVYLGYPSASAGR